MFDDDKTQVLTEGTEDYPLDATLAATPEECPNCQAEILAANQFCSKCGYQRGTWAIEASNDDQPVKQVLALYNLVGEEVTIAVPAGESIVGRGDVDLKLSDGYLSRKHAKFVVAEDSFEVTDLGSANGSFVDGSQLVPNEAMLITAGQNLKLGQTEYVVEVVEILVTEDNLESVEDGQVTGSVDEATSQDVETAGALNADDRGEPAEALVEEILLSGWSLKSTSDYVHEIAIGETTMGRSAGKSDIALKGDGYISSLHVKLAATAITFAAEDLGSTNGTKLNGESLVAGVSVALSDGDLLRVGETEFTVCQAEEVEVTDNPNEGE